MKVIPEMRRAYYIRFYFNGHISSVVDRRLEPRSDQNKDNKIGSVSSYKLFVWIV
jgi:hypothetical protein